MLEQVGLAGAARRRVGGFSLGMRQRLGVAAALLGDPGVLLFDEPVNGLDPEGIRWIRELMRSLAAEGRTVLVSSHLMSEMAVTADHVLVVGRGRLITETTMAEMAERMTAPRDGRISAMMLPGLAVQLAGEQSDAVLPPYGALVVMALYVTAALAAGALAATRRDA